MIKTKEDDFLGDNYTSNIKYAENEWQAHGTVDRDSVYTKEPLLDLIFEGFNYSRELGDYEDYIARASTLSITNTSTDAVEYVGAKLQHDLMILDTMYYTSSITNCVVNIFSVETFLKKAIAVANPMYDDKARVKTICLLDESALASSKITVKEFFKYILPGTYSEATGVNTDDEALVRVLERYTTGAVSSDYNSSLSAPDRLGLDISSLKEKTMTNFLAAIDVPIYGDSTGKTIKQQFLEDFSLTLHSKDSIKMPFHTRDDESDDRFYRTRFLVNLINETIYKKTDLSNLYLEQLNELIEETLFSEKGAELWLDSSAVLADKTTSDVLAEKVYESGAYKHLYDKLGKFEKNVLKYYTKNLKALTSNIAYYTTPVYTGFSSTQNDPKTSWGIHYINEESTENLFQDTDNTYRLYNKVLLGYKLIDAIISNRTFLGGLFYLMGTKGSENDIPIDDPLRLRTVNRSFSTMVNDDLESLNYYPTVSILNNLYKLGHATASTINEIRSELNIEQSENYAYILAKPIKEWLKNECILYKGPVYGDYVEELNFMQDLNPDSNVTFKNLRVKKTTIPYKRLQDSKYEVPFLEQTAPLLNNTKNVSKGFEVVASDSFAGVGNKKGSELDLNANTTTNTIPPIWYDFDKGDQEALMASIIDPRQLSEDSDKQRILRNEGVMIVEERIQSPTIDELWTFLKYLTESDGSGLDTSVNERLPKFFGIKKDYVLGTINAENSYVATSAGDRGNGSFRNRLNPEALDKDRENVIDILNWSPNNFNEPNLHWAKGSDTAEELDKPELQFGGYKITRYIEKIYDYAIQPFSRRESELDGDPYEFNTESSQEFNVVKGYLEKLYNSAILSFNAPELDKSTVVPAAVDSSLLEAHVLRDSVDNQGTKIFSKANDDKLITVNNPVHNTIERSKAFQDIVKILKYHNVDGSTGIDNDLGSGKSYHNHYKEYLENPKNLKEIERDLETIRQNLQTLTEFMVSSYASLGYADRSKNRGTLYQLHKNAYEFLSTWLLEVNATVAGLPDTTYDTSIELNDLTDSLNYTLEVLAENATTVTEFEKLNVVKLDKKVVFDDGVYEDRYLRENYDKYAIDLNTDPLNNTRAKHPMYRVNETLLSETYLAGDGTWRSVHEHTVLPIIFSEH